MPQMTADLSTPQLVELVHQYYPSHLWDADEGYAGSEQYQRLVRARQEATLLGTTVAISPGSPCSR